MIKKSIKKVATPKKTIRKILITQPRPEGTKSPYFDLAVKYGLSLDFHPFIKVEGIPSKDFRKQKIDIAAFTAVIFTSRNAIDHFFRICEEMKVTVSQDTKYFFFI
jgi:uroporphyrinogen-III synthase